MKVVCGSGICGLKLFNILIFPAMIEEKFTLCIMKLKVKFGLATAGQRQRALVFVRYLKKAGTCCQRLTLPSLTQLGHLSHVMFPFALVSRRERSTSESSAVHSSATCIRIFQTYILVGHEYEIVRVCYRTSDFGRHTKLWLLPTLKY